MAAHGFRKGDRVRSLSDPAHEALGHGHVAKVTDQRVFVKYPGRKHLRNYHPGQIRKLDPAKDLPLR